MFENTQILWVSNFLISLFLLYLCFGVFLEYHIEILAAMPLRVNMTVKPIF